MKVALIGPKELSDFDKEEIEKYIDVIVSNGHTVSILAHQSIEIEVMKYFVKRPEFASQLKIYTFQDIDNTAKKTKLSIEFLISKGASHHSFSYNEWVIRRKKYTEVWDVIIAESASIVCFYNNEESKLMIPVDQAVKHNKRALVYQLPGQDERLHELPPEEKMQLKKHHGLS